jgi:hypothetical protein
MCSTRTGLPLRGRFQQGSQSRHVWKAQYPTRALCATSKFLLSPGPQSHSNTREEHCDICHQGPVSKSGIYTVLGPATFVEFATGTTTNGWNNWRRFFGRRMRERSAVDDFVAAVWRVAVTANGGFDGCGRVSSCVIELVLAAAGDPSREAERTIARRPPRTANT